MLAQVFARVYGMYKPMWLILMFQTLLRQNST